MAVISRPHSARLRFINAAENTVQSLNRIAPNLQLTDVQGIRQAINEVRRNDAGQPAVGGYYIVSDELVEA
ncbi:MAG: hypothetical protein FWF78_04910 [Defluviitaleaceae bacterium]|nr:hypothetical protein [Defluviitaleaceae bacterium]